ncbi:prolyl hydroxylase EGLN3-like isoform X2 [Xenia sp. Carnegie-2017]|uniref:prolyl hydroxylase EGLN3-like isoform X2 n=1 Tax=Xenia sp. Carnegie-2017 TaxID=2897299 RepID=UPI001F04E810|nr:prolyl hydroxylase EGLN3-like isoform X2 [Xenia sp. Carnegie-2017]
MASNYRLDCKPLDMPKNCTACESFNSYISGDDFLAYKRSNVLESLARNVLRKLETQGYCVVDRFHKEENALKILEEVKRIHKSGSMQKGQLSNSLTSENDRGDLIAWVKGKEEGKENIGLHIRRCDALFRELNKLMPDRIIEGRTQGMISCYPGGGRRYRKHVDNPNQDGRLITALYYLNQNYDNIVNGGELRLYPHGSEAYVDIEPIFDRLFLFWSDRRNPHEVLPVHTTRYAITLWYFDKEERLAEYQRFRSRVSIKENEM